MSRLTEFQIYAQIKGLKAAIARYEHAGSTAGPRRAAKKSAKRLAEYEAELDARLKFLAAHGQAMAEVGTMLAEVR